MDYGKAKTQDISAIKGGANILLIGSDTRVGQTAEQHDADGARNDVTMLVHISEDHSQVTIVSFPRDTMVPIPACTDPDTGKSSYPQTKAMFNTSLAEGGPKGGVACVVQTVENLTGLSIPYAGLITFDGVIAMSNALGGVTVCIAKPIHDGTFLNLPAGQVPLKGDQALAFLRTRHGVGDGSDVARISNQQVFLSAMLRQLTSDGALSNPVTLYKFASAATSNMTLSEGLNNTGTLVSLAAAVRNTNTSDMLLVQYPTEQDPENINRLVVSQDAAHSLNVALQDDARTQIAQGAIGRGAVVSPGASPLPNSGSNNSSPEPKPSSGTPVSNGAAPSDNTPVALPSSVTGQSAAEQTCSKGTRQ
ncbi:LCP family protein [Curtobacterium sp. ISL-83]|uniref:LCP family protein n=1 Tax=Curtobacterium sp. ISL-83 TaxID=2819145 RepID=UPI001BEB3139|nr:LCP family protein [Curtobacterium sp. ISL-83]MBT2501062.1 LCP family protein [Curtobacterium sp. ISL-83]